MAINLYNKKYVLGAIGTLIVASGTLFAIFWLSLFENEFEKKMILGPDSKSYDIWKTPPLPMSLDIYFFNWTNPSNFSENFVKPILQEVGPYRFTENMDKVNISWHPENSTVSFRKKSTFFYDAAGSKGQLDDIITTLNIIALSAAAKARYWSPLKQRTVSVGLNMYQQLGHVTKTASELLFEGYQDDLIDVARDMGDMSFLGGNEELSIPYDRFGWFYGRNNTANTTGHYNMHTGADDFSQIGVVKHWDFRNRTDFFPDHCGMVNGSAGEFYASKQVKHKPIQFFSPDMCRSLSFDYQKTVNINGLDGYKFIGGEKTVDNGTKYPENECFSSGEKVPSGVMNVSACRYGTPVFMSFPHYYAADPYYLDQVEGLKPIKEKHEFFITLEPTTGVALDVAARFQINMLVQPTNNIGLYHNSPSIFFPVLWFEQKVQITQEMADDLKMALLIPTIGYFITGAYIICGLLLIIWLPLIQPMLQKKEKANATYSITTTKDGKSLNSKEENIPEGSPLLTKKNGKNIEISNFNANIPKTKKDNSSCVSNTVSEPSTLHIKSEKINETKN